MKENRNTLVAAAIIFIGLGLFAWFLPRIMLAAADVSIWAAGAIAAFFLVGIFLLFWLRGRYQGRR